MELKRRVALNGIQLDEVDERIVITSVEPGDGQENITAVDAAAGYGQRITGCRRRTVDMVVRFSIHENGRSTAGQQARSEVLEAVNAWAAQATKGAYLTVNYKPERRLYVVLAQAPGEGTLWEWSREFSITFRAYAVPYWEEETRRSARIGNDGISGSDTILMEGSAVTAVDAELLNMSGMAVQSAAITIGQKTIRVSGLGMAANEALVIDHTADALIRIRIRAANGSYRSVMDKRTTDSADDFTAAPGSTSVSYEAQRGCRLTLYWRCRFL